METTYSVASVCLPNGTCLQLEPSECTWGRRGRVSGWEGGVGAAGVGAVLGVLAGEKVFRCSYLVGSACPGNSPPCFPPVGPPCHHSEPAPPSSRPKPRPCLPTAHRLPPGQDPSGISSPSLLPALPAGVSQTCLPRTQTPKSEQEL